MEIVHGFFDYCLSENCITDEEFPETLTLLKELGYKTVAINQILDESNLEPRKKKKKGQSRDASDIVPEPIDLKQYKDTIDIKILNRLTIVFSTQDIFSKILKSPNFKKYNIIAVTPLTQSAIQFTCSSLEIDILSYDPENKISYKLTRKLYNQLVEKGVHYEIVYAPAVQDSTQRKNMIHMSHLYHSFGKSRNIIISSGATKRILIRSPYDVINLGFIFGLNEEQAKNAILSNGRNVFLNSVGRRRGKTFMLAESDEEINIKSDAVISEAKDEDMDVGTPDCKRHKK